MTQQTVLEIAAPACVAQEFEGEVIALNLEKGTYYSLRGLSAILWRDLAAGHPVETLAALMAAHPGGAQQVSEFATNLAAQGLLRPAPSGVAIKAEPAFAAAVPANTAIDLTFEVFDDMNSLILLDPVHDIDTSRGWPNPPPTDR
jgi:hypothetical protein